MKRDEDVAAPRGVVDNDNWSMRSSGAESVEKVVFSKKPSEPGKDRICETIKKSATVSDLDDFTTKFGRSLAAQIVNSHNHMTRIFSVRRRYDARRVGMPFHFTPLTTKGERPHMLSTVLRTMRTEH